MEGFEPPRHIGRCVLSAVCLPFHHTGNFKDGRGETTCTSSALKLLFPKQVGYYLPIYAPKNFGSHVSDFPHPVICWSLLWFSGSQFCSAAAAARVREHAFEKWSELRESNSPTPAWKAGAPPLYQIRKWQVVPQGSLPTRVLRNGAAGVTRKPTLPLTGRLLCHLSYIGVVYCSCMYFFVAVSTHHYTF